MAYSQRLRFFLRAIPRKVQKSAFFQDFGGRRIPCLDGPIRANRFADSRESPDSRESFQGSRIEPLFRELRFGGLKVANRRFEAIRANRSNVKKIGVVLRIDSRE